jgi:hypothetical protein
LLAIKRWSASHPTREFGMTIDRLGTCGRIDAGNLYENHQAGQTGARRESAFHRTGRLSIAAAIIDY